MLLHSAQNRKEAMFLSADVRGRFASKAQVPSVCSPPAREAVVAPAFTAKAFIKNKLSKVKNEKYFKMIVITWQV